MTESGSLLIVDDETMARTMLCRHLGRAGFTITEAEAGQQALELIDRQPFDLILLDIEMPDLGGLEVLARIRGTHTPTNLPVIMATAHDESTEVVAALQQGANDYLTKPFDFPVVLARVRTQLALKRAVERIVGLERSLTQRNTELEAANKELIRANRRMKRDLEGAARVQEALLPAGMPQVAGAHFAWAFRPCDELAGDLLNVASGTDGRVCLYVLDVVGHGAAAALLAVRVNQALTRLPASLPPAEVVNQLNGLFPWDDRTEQFFTLLYGVLDTGRGEFRFVSAGHPGPVLLPRSGPPQVGKGRSPPVGLGEGEYEEQTLALGEGDRLYLHSDGLSEVQREGTGAFGMPRVLSALDTVRELSLRDGLTALLRDVVEWCSPSPPHDDISVLAVELASTSGGMQGNNP